MGKEQVKVIHLDTEHSWRGGQQQAVYLFEGMLAKGYDTVMVCQPGSEMENYCINKALPYHSMTFAHELDYKAGRNLALFARNYKASVIHLHTGHSVSWGLWAKLFNWKIKLIATRRVDFSIKKNPLSVLKYNTKLLDHIVCISEKIKQVLMQDGIPENKMSVIHSGINIHRFDNCIVTSDFRERWGIPESAFIVGTVAAFSGHKDYPNFIKAASIVLASRDDIRFMAVGDGELLLSMKEYALELNIADRLIFTGFQSNVGEFLKAFDVFVLASKMEGLGTSVLDAMSVGVPIVATNAGGIPEMITSGVNGLLVDSKDSDALAKTIPELIDNETLRKSFSRAELLSVKEFDISKTINQYITIYKELSGAEF